MEEVINEISKEYGGQFLGATGKENISILEFKINNKIKQIELTEVEMLSDDVLQIIADKLSAED